MFKLKSNLFKNFLLVSMIMVISGCSISFGGGKGGNDGGVYVSANNGNTWQQKNLIPTTSGGPKSISAINVNVLVMDPSDPKALYYGSIDNGLFYTYNNTSEWHSVSGLAKATINDLAVDPNSKCIIYAAMGNKVYKSTDCNRTWTQIYFDNDTSVQVRTIVVDHYDSASLYIGTSRGEIIKSINRGVSWQTIVRFDDNIIRLFISPHDSRLMFAATAKKGIFRSSDNGINWVSLKDNLADFKNSSDFRDMVLSPAEPDLIFLATKYGLLKSVDNGNNWTTIELITPEAKATINAIAISPKNVKEIYYVTNTTFYRSNDGGENWSTKKLPTTRAGWKLLINPEETSIIYMGVKGLK